MNFGFLLLRKYQKETKNKLRNKSFARVGKYHVNVSSISASDKHSQNKCQWKVISQILSSRAH